MALILNIETATEVCSVALGLDGRVLCSETICTPNQHAGQTTVLIARLFEQSGYTLQNLHAVAVSSGPGSYTGLRIGASVAKGICFALHLPLIAIPTLKGIAQGARERFPEADLLIPVIDARRQEVYAARYTSELVNTQPVYSWIIEPGDLDPLHQAGTVVIAGGKGAEKAQEILDNDHFIYDPIAASADFLVPLSELAYRQKKFEEVASFTPFYLKPPNITTPKTL